MAILGIGYVISIECDSTDTFKADVKVVSNDGTSQGVANLTGLPISGLSQFVFNTALKNGVKGFMINNLGFTFGLLDTVAIVGNSVI